MVPTFGMLDFLPERLVRTQADSNERDAYLSEVNTFSTEFGAKAENEAYIHTQACLRMALLLNRF